MFSTSNKLDRILTKCIQSIEEKSWTIDDCLKQYPSFRTELEPMLQTALKLRQARKFGPSTTFQSDAQSRIRRRLQSSRRSPWLGKTTRSIAIQSRAATRTPGMRLAGSLIPLLVISLALIVVGGSLAYAADNARPGDVLFQVDRAIEQIRIRLENDIHHSVRLHLQFASERIEEAFQLLERDNIEDLVSALVEYKVQILAIAPLITEAQSSGEDVSQLVLEISEVIINHKHELNDLIQAAPISIVEFIQSTLEDAEKTRRLVLSPVPIDEPVVKVTPEPLVFAPEIPTEKTPILPTPTPFPTNAPPSPTENVEPHPTPTAMPPSSKPDLVSENLVLEPEYPVVNMLLKISGVVKNQGNLTAGNFGVIFCVDSSVETCYQDREGDIGIYLNFSSLTPGVSEPVHTYAWLPDTAGEHMVHICADIDHSVNESNEGASSNCVSKIFTVLDSGLIPDLTIVENDWPLEAFEDDDVVFFYSVTNEGTGIAERGYLNQLFIDDQLVPNLGSQIGSFEGDTLFPGVSESRGFVWRAKCGTHQVIARTDATDQVSETNEDNNVTILHTIIVYCHVY